MRTGSARVIEDVAPSSTGGSRLLVLPGRLGTKVPPPSSSADFTRLAVAALSPDGPEADFLATNVPALSSGSSLGNEPASP